MRLLLIFFTYLLALVSLRAQSDVNPAVWTHEVKKISETEYELVFKGKLFEGWHLYSQFTAAGGSMPSEFDFDKAGEDYELLGKTAESKTITEYNAIFEVDETFFEDEAVFTQRIKLLKPEVNQIAIKLFYQICKEVCIPKEEFFEISLKI